MTAADMSRLEYRQSLGLGASGQERKAEMPMADLISALKASDDLIKEAQGILEAHLYPDSSQDADQTVNALLELLDGPKQREVQKNTRAALAEARPS